MLVLNDAQNGTSTGEAARTDNLWNGGSGKVNLCVSEEERAVRALAPQFAVESALHSAL
jgi:hypothetical protein